MNGHQPVENFAALDEGEWSLELRRLCRDGIDGHALRSGTLGAEREEQHYNKPTHVRLLLGCG